ncbi:MAG TPA: hypothetical protein VGD35_04150 [Chitinophaga sp.]
MKRFFPIALMLCLFVSLSSFAPVHPNATVMKKGTYAYSFPIYGSTTGTQGQGGPVGTIYYTVTGSGTIPSTIQFTTGPNGTGTSLGTYPFTLAEPNNYLAGGLGMKAQTSISGVYFHISSACGTGYCLEFIGGI